MKRPEACSHLRAVTILQDELLGIARLKMGLGAAWGWLGFGPCRCQVGTISAFPGCRLAQAARLPGCSP